MAMRASSPSLFVRCLINGMGLGLSLFLLMTRSHDVSFVPDTVAAPVQGTAAISGSCSDTPVTAFAMDGDYTITWAAPSASASPSCSATLSMPSGQVNGDPVPGVACTVSVGMPGFVVLHNRQPSMKLGGLVCATQDRSTLEVHGDGSDNLAIDIGLYDVTATDWAGANKVDHIGAGNPKMLFGASGLIGASAIIDGTDHDLSTNGEVEFGGTVASEGASRIKVKVDYSNYDVQAATDKETLTYTFTPQ